MPQDPLVTIAISCYNHERYIEESLLSAIKQTYKNIELLVFDDGSTDDSVSKINALKKKYSFTFQAQKNKGLSQTLNTALSISKGKYFVPFGSDDKMLPDRIEKQVAYMAQHSNTAICGGNILKIDDNGTIVANQKINPPATQCFYDLFLNRGPGIPAPTMFFRTENLKSIGGFNPNIPLEDLYVQLKLTHKGYTADVMNDVLAYYRIHPDNTYKNLEYMLNNVLKTYECFKDDPYYEQAKYKFLNGMLLRTAKRNTKLAIQVLSMIPFRHYNNKTWRALPKLIFSKGKANV